MVVFSFSVLDVNGQPLSGFKYTSDSGTNYNIPGAVFVTPEPATVSLTITSLLAILLLRRGLGLIQAGQRAVADA
jgi:hypothetical protein